MVHSQIFRAASVDMWEVYTSNMLNEHMILLEIWLDEFS
jgi:hypothetical protein